MALFGMHQLTTALLRGIPSEKLPGGLKVSPKLQFYNHYAWEVDINPKTIPSIPKGRKELDNATNGLGQAMKSINSGILRRSTG